MQVSFPTTNLLFPLLISDPVISKRPITGGEHALRIFNCNIEQYCEGDPLTESQRGAVNAAYLATLEMLGMDEESRKSSSRNWNGNARKRQRVEESTPIEDPCRSTLAPLTPAFPLTTAASIATAPPIGTMMTSCFTGPINDDGEMINRTGMHQAELSDFPGQDSELAIHVDEETSQEVESQPMNFPEILVQGNNVTLNDDIQSSQGAGFVPEGNADFSNFFSQHDTSNMDFSF